MVYEIEDLTMKDSGTQGQKVTNDVDVIDELKEKFNPFQEELWLFGLNGSNEIVFKDVIFRGKMDRFEVDMKVLFRYLLKTLSESFIIAHNHPSGITTPSQQDILVTNRILECASLLDFELLDHIVYTKTDHFSMYNKGLMSEYKRRQKISSRRVR